MKKFSLMTVAAVVALAAWSSTASAQQCGGRGGLFGGHRGGCGSHHGFFGGHQSCGQQSYASGCGQSYSSVAFSGNSCQSQNGYVVIGQPQYVEPYQGGTKTMPNPAYSPPYQGEKKTGAEDLPLPPKKIQPPNPRQDGPQANNILYINGIPHGMLSDGSYANIQDGTFQRLNTAYGSTPRK